jgi:hypothetical protein
MTEPRPVIVVPWRGGNKYRERNWEFCKTWWAQFGWPVVEVEHEGELPFNRSWTINEGARRGWPWDVLVAVDADVIEADPQQVVDGVRVAHETQKLVVPHIAGHDLDDAGSKLLIADRPGWERRVQKKRPVCNSRVTIVPESVYEKVGGFDDRFQGWGHEDVAFYACARTVNGMEQLPGIAYHLWHPLSLPKARATPEWREGRDLCDRYLVADRNGWVALKEILDERSPADRWERPEGDQPPRSRTLGPSRAVDVIVLTAGRKGYLERTLASFAERVTGDIAARIIQDDSGDPGFNVWLKETYPDWEIVTTPGKLGFTKAIRHIHQVLRVRTGSPYVFHLEEDFVFDRDVDTSEMIALLEADGHLAQVALLRGPFYEPELEAGGIIEQDPDAYEHRDGHVVHSKYFTTNPCVYRRSLVLKHHWPGTRNSEGAYTKQLVRKGFRFAFIGDGTPWVSHIGEERTNLGY